MLYCSCLSDSIRQRAKISEPTLNSVGSGTISVGSEIFAPLPNRIRKTAKIQHLSVIRHLFHIKKYVEYHVPEVLPGVPEVSPGCPRSGSPDMDFSGLKPEFPN